MKDKRTVAHVAAMYANDEMVDVLIKKGVDFTTPAGVSLNLQKNFSNNFFTV